MGDSPRRIAVTGAAGYIGTRLLQRLESERQVERILAIDVRPHQNPLGPKVTVLQHDVSTPFDHSLSEHQIDAVVHLAYVLRPSRDRTVARRVNVLGMSNLITACANGGVRKIIYLSSTSVYGAHADNPPMLTEDDPPRPVKGFQYSENKVRAEQLIQLFAKRRPDVSGTILRVCPVMGPNADNFISRAFLKPFLPAVKGFDPAMQFIHEDDLIDVLTLCTLRDAPGLFNLAGAGAIRWSEMAELLGRRLVTIPPSLLYAATDATWALRLQSDSPSCGLNFIRYPWTASTEKIQRELGVKPRYSSREAWEAFAGQRRRHRR